MPRVNDLLRLSDRHARNAILAAEQQGYRRPRDLHPRSYDARLRNDGSEAHAFLANHRPALLAEALARPDPIEPESGAIWIVDDGRVTLTATSVTALRANAFADSQGPRMSHPGPLASLGTAQLTLGLQAVPTSGTHGADSIELR